jgi:hypothetical protein
MMGWVGEGGGGEKYKGECLFHNNHNKDEYNNDNKYNDKEDGKGSHDGVDDGGESNYDGRDVIRRPSFGGVGRRMLIVSPHTAAAIMDNNNIANNCRRSGGRHAPPLRSVLSHWMPLVVNDVTNRGWWWRHEGVWGVVVCGVEEEGPRCCTHLSGF